MELDLSNLRSYVGSQADRPLNLWGKKSQSCKSTEARRLKVKELIDENNIKSDIKMQNYRKQNSTGSLSDSDYKFAKLEACVESFIKFLHISALYSDVKSKQ